MGDKSAIEWTDATWNPIRGCSRVSEGCRNCYAERTAARFSGPGQPYEGLAKIGRVTMTDGQRTHTTPFRWTGEVRFVEEALTLPLRWGTPRHIFVNSMSDLFHEKVRDEWIDRIFAIMLDAQRHTFQILTKRPKRMLAYLSDERRRRNWIAGWFKGNHKRDATSLATVIPDAFWPLLNVWLGVSVEDQATADKRIPLLLQTPAAVRWVSYEPALGPVDFARWVFDRCAEVDRLVNGPAMLNRYQAEASVHRSLDWLVVGGESGPGARPFDLAWARSVITQCRGVDVSVFVKQLGAAPTGEWGKYEPIPLIRETATCGWVHVLRDRKGGDWSEWPEDLRLREYPRVDRQVAL